MKWHVGLKTYLRAGHGHYFWMPALLWHMAPAVAHLMAEELNKDESWEKEQVLSFISIAKNYLLND